MIRSTKLGPLTWMHAKYGRWTPSRTYLPAKTVLVHNTPNLGCLLKHGCAWQIRCSGRSAPIFWGRTRFWYSKWMHNRFGGLNIKKIDFALIFSVLAQPQIWGFMSRTSKISAASFFFEPNPPTCLVKTLDNHILVRPPNMGGKLREMRSYQPKQYLCTCPILAANFAGTKNIVTNFFSWWICKYYYTSSLWI